jgi:prepilin-type N-terminal cleavage/methylation domain-containing protein
MRFYNYRLYDGFTLLEMLVVLAVLAILLGIAGLTLSGYIRNLRLTETARTFGEALQRARELALTRSEIVTVTVDGADLTWTGEGGTTVTQTLPYGASVTNPANPADLVFSGRGLPQTGQLFTLELYEQTRQVFVSPTGAVMYL